VVERSALRVSDSERQAAVDRLRLAHDEGRLDLEEYDRRLAAAYSSVTYGDLDRLFLDLPAAGTAAAVHRPSAGVPAPRKAAAVTVPVGGVLARQPLALKVLWTVYASVVAINLMVWLLVSLGNADPVYFWPMWLLIPGVALGTVTASIDAHRRGR
jgi:hypothetical protein